MILTTTGKIWQRNTVTIIAKKKCSQWLVSFTCQLRLNILLFSGLIYTWYFSPITWDPTCNWKKTAGRHSMSWKIDLINGQRQGSGPPELLFYGALFCIWRLSTKTTISIWGLLIFFIWEEEGLDKTPTSEGVSVPHVTSGKLFIQLSTVGHGPCRISKIWDSQPIARLSLILWELIVSCSKVKNG